MRLHPYLQLNTTLFFLLSLLSLGIHAQEAAELITIGEKQIFHSNVLNEDRELWVYKPPSYSSADSHRYAVIYLLDASYQFHHITGIVEFLVANDRIPETIVVALPNTDRTRDLTPPTQTDSTHAFPSAGGADNFLNFLADELIPYVDATFRTFPHRTLVGHSFGGLFAIYSLLHRPEVFNNYIATSPSLWWNDAKLVSNAKSLLEKNLDDAPRYLYMTMGDEGGNMLGSAWRLSAILEENAPDSFQWNFKLMDKETHGSIPHKSTYQALEAIYSDWQIPDIIQLVKNHGIEAVDKHYVMLSKKYGHTISTPERVINQLGYWYLSEGETETAIHLFLRNVKIYPSSANVYDSLADAYKANHQLNLAKDHYKKAVEIAEATLHPNLEVYKSNLKDIEKRINSK